VSAKPKNPEPEFDETDLSELEQQIVDLTAALQRERADAINVRRRADEERERLAAIHKASVIRSLLPVIDNFERALKHVPKNLDSASGEFIKGVAAIVAQFEKTLSGLGVSKIKTVGEEFNPELHEAVSMDEGEGGTREIISEELQSGYTLGDEVLRHAMVRVELQP
jgi:molecular chaperone GrpE